ncbi:MAG: MerR family transcriptional regulator [Bacteroidales bacterium]|nr:MerR family transcriptional regulator [Bacteroidales bacterium]
MEKLYYSISDVARMFGVNTSLIRYWEKEFDCIRPVKNKKGNRQFTQSDIDNIRKIYHLTKECGFTLAGAKEQLKTAEIEDEKLKALDTLAEIKAFLIDLRQAL